MGFCSHEPHWVTGESIEKLDEGDFEKYLRRYGHFAKSLKDMVYDIPAFTILVDVFVKLSKDGSTWVSWI